MRFVAQAAQENSSYFASPVSFVSSSRKKEENISDRGQSIPV